MMIYVKSIVGCYVISIIFTLLFLFAVDSGKSMHKYYDYEYKFKVALIVIIILNIFMPAVFGLLIGEIASDSAEMQQIVIATFEQVLDCPTANIELSSDGMDALNIDPCPFCGEDSTVVIGNNFGDYQYYIHCSECGSRAEQVADSIEGLITEWNGEEE